MILKFFIIKIIQYLIGFTSVLLGFISDKKLFYILEKQFNYSNLSYINKTFLNSIIFYDSEYFLIIKDKGYVSSKMLAFLPGYPLFLKLISNIFQGNFYWIYLVLVIQLVLNYLTGYFLKKIALKLNYKEKFSNIIMIISFLEPYSFYRNLIYSENLFLFLTTLALYFLYKNELNTLRLNFFNWIISSILIFLSGFVRSNGFLTVIPVGWFMIFSMIRDIITLKKINITIIHVFKGAIIFIISTFSFILMNYFHYIKFCKNVWLENQEEILLCNKKLPLIYSYIQKKYWDVYIFSIKGQRNPINIVYSMPFLAVFIIYFKRNNFRYFFKIKGKLDTNDLIKPEFMLFFVLLLISLIMVHFNTIPRLMSCYPFYYLVLADIIKNYLDNSKKYSIKEYKYIIYYLLFYGIVIIKLSSNMIMPI